VFGIFIGKLLLLLCLQFSVGSPSFASSLNTIVPDLDKTLRLVIPADVLKQRSSKKIDVDLSKVSLPLNINVVGR
jgi:hypothetical protein